MRRCLIHRGVLATCFMQRRLGRLPEGAEPSSVAEVGGVRREVIHQQRIVRHGEVGEALGVVCDMGPLSSGSLIENSKALAKYIRKGVFCRGAVEVYEDDDGDDACDDHQQQLRDEAGE